MVALKLVFGSPQGLALAVKQERRGGIETEALSAGPVSRLAEAGTPWWH